MNKVRCSTAKAFNAVCFANTNLKLSGIRWNTWELVFLFVFFFPLWVIKRSSIYLYIYLFSGFNDADIQLFVVDDYVNENFGQKQEVCFEKDVI